MDYLVKDNDIDLIPDKVYEVVKEEKFFYGVVDESGETYSYPKSFFEIVKPDDGTVPKKQ